MFQVNKRFTSRICLHHQGFYTIQPAASLNHVRTLTMEKDSVSEKLGLLEPCDAAVSLSCLYSSQYVLYTLRTINIIWLNFRFNRIYLRQAVIIQLQSFRLAVYAGLLPRLAFFFPPLRVVVSFSPLWLCGNLHGTRRWMEHPLLSLCSVGIHLKVTSSASNWKYFVLRKKQRT